MQFITRFSVLLFVFFFSGFAQSAMVCNPNNTSNATASCGDRNGLAVYAEFDYEQSGTFNYSCYYMGGADKDTPYKFKSVTCGGTCPEELFFDSDKGSCEEEPDSSDDGTCETDRQNTRLQKFKFGEGETPSMPYALCDPVQKCSYFRSQGGCTGGNCVAAYYKGGGSCGAEGDENIPQFEDLDTDHEPTFKEIYANGTVSPDGKDEMPMGFQYTDDSVFIDTTKVGNCGTVNGVQKCFPLAEDSGSGKDHQVVAVNEPKPDTPIIGYVADNPSNPNSALSTVHEKESTDTPKKGQFDSGSTTSIVNNGASGSGNSGSDSGSTDGSADGSESGEQGGDSDGSEDGDTDGTGEEEGEEETGKELSKKGSYDSDDTDTEIADFKTKIASQVSTIRSEASNMFSNNQGGSGSLYCKRNIAIGGTGESFDICLDDYKQELSIIGIIILSLSLVSSVYIMLR